MNHSVRRRLGSLDWGNSIPDRLAQLTFGEVVVVQNGYPNLLY